MIRAIAALAALMISLALPLSADDTTQEQDARSACETTCVEKEEACYDRCPKRDDEGTCADACYSAADECINRCAD